MASTSTSAAVMLMACRMVSASTRSFMSMRPSAKMASMGPRVVAVKAGIRDRLASVRLFQRFHAKTVHPVRRGQGSMLLQVHRHVERLTGEQIDARLMFSLSCSPPVDREGMNKVVDNAPEVDQMLEEERESFDAFLFAKSQQFKPVRVHIRRQGERDVGRERVKYLAVEA